MAFANSLDPDETPQNVASHQDPNCCAILIVLFAAKYKFPKTKLLICRNLADNIVKADDKFP